jgi:hypothetical protein
MRQLRMPRLPLLLILIAAGLLAFPFEAFPQDSNSAAQLEQQAAADRAQAAKLRADAAQWNAMAGKAKARAAGANSDTVKQIWDRNAADDQTNAQQMTDQAAALEKRADSESAEAATANQKAQAQPSAPASPPQQASSQPSSAVSASPAANPSPQTVSAPSPVPAPMTTSVASGEPPTTQPSGASAQTADKPIELDEIVGNWLNTADHSIVEIKEMNPGENKGAVLFKGRHDEWGGFFTRGSGDKPSHLSYSMGPKFEQMNPQAPQWARQQVSGKLRWFLELDTEGCGPKLSGKWYRGEIKWTDSDQPGAAKEASAVSHVRDVPVEFEKTSEKLDYEGHASIRVRSVLRKLPFATADSLFHDEPFYVDVILPEDEAKRVGMDLTVTLHSAIGNDTSTLGLSSFSPDVHRFAVYTTLDPVTMAHGGVGAHHGMIAHLFSQGLKAAMPGNMSRLKFVNRDTVTVSYGDVHTSFTAYAQPVLQDEARVEASLRQLEVGFNAELANADTDGARGLTMKLRMIKNALRIIDDEMTISDGVHNPYNAYSVGAAYLTMLTDATVWKPTPAGSKPSGAWDPLYPSGQLVPDPRFPAVGYYSNFERVGVDQALERGRRRAEKVVGLALDRAGLAAVQFFIASTGADQFAIIAFGVDMNGQPVDAMTRFTTGLSFGGSLILRGVSIAQKVQGEMVEAERSAARYAGPKAAEAASAEEKVVGEVAGGASGGSRFAAKGIPAQVIIGAESDLETHLPSTKIDFTLPGAKTVTDRSGKDVGFLLQKFDDTCGVVVGETMARDAGAQLLSEEQGMIKAYQDAKKAYRAGAGMTVVGMRDYLKSRGAQAAAFLNGVTLTRIEDELARGGQVAVLINTQPPGEKPSCHWVRVFKIERGSNGVPTNVIYGDPWTGTKCQAGACVFRSSMIKTNVPANQKTRQFGVVFAMW